MVNPIVCHLPFTGEDAIVFYYCLFNPVHGRQSLCMIFLGICFDLADLGSMSSPLTVIGCYFCSYFRPFSTQLHFTFITPPFSLILILTMFIPLCLSCSRTNDKNTIRLVLPDTEGLNYWAIDILKQSCGGFSSPGSCAGTFSAATECSHHSKFQTSRTRSMSRSVSITQTLLVIDRFLATTAARLPRPTAAIR